MIPIRDRAILVIMRIIARRTLREFWERHRLSKRYLEAWYADVKTACWITPQDIKSEYQAASFLKENRVVFNIKGNTYRLVTRINYDYQIVYIKFVGTHKEYDQIDANTV